MARRRQVHTSWPALVFLLPPLMLSCSLTADGPRLLLSATMPSRGAAWRLHNTKGASATSNVRDFAALALGERVMVPPIARE